VECRFVSRPEPDVGYVTTTSTSAELLETAGLGGRNHERWQNHLLASDRSAPASTTSFYVGLKRDERGVTVEPRYLVSPSLPRAADLQPLYSRNLALSDADRDEECLPGRCRHRGACMA